MGQAFFFFDKIQYKYSITILNLLFFYFYVGNQ